MCQYSMVTLLILKNKKLALNNEIIQINSRFIEIYTFIETKYFLKVLRRIVQASINVS